MPFDPRPPTALLAILGALLALILALLIPLAGNDANASYNEDPTHPYARHAARPIPDGARACENRDGGRLPCFYNARKRGNRKGEPYWIDRKLRLHFHHDDVRDWIERGNSRAWRRIDVSDPSHRHAGHGPVFRLPGPRPALIRGFDGYAYVQR